MMLAAVAVGALAWLYRKGSRVWQTARKLRRSFREICLNPKSTLDDEHCRQLAIGSPWALTVARRVMLNWHRALKPEVPLEEAENWPAPQRGPGEAAESDLWQFARRRLPAESFELLWLCYGERFEPAEIAAVTGRTGVHVRVLLYRACAALARALEQASASELPAAVTPRPAATGASPVSAPPECGAAAAGARFFTPPMLTHSTYSSGVISEAGLSHLPCASAAGASSRTRAKAVRLRMAGIFRGRSRRF